MASAVADTADNGVVYRGSFLPCSEISCGGYPQNVATMALEKGVVVIKKDGDVIVKLKKLTDLATGEILANKTLDVFIVTFSPCDAINCIGIGQITTDINGNFEGPVMNTYFTDILKYPLGVSIATPTFVINDPGVRSEFITGFMIPSPNGYGY